MGLEQYDFNINGDDLLQMCAKQQLPSARVAINV